MIFNELWGDSLMEPLTFIGLPLCTRSNSKGMASAVKILRDTGITEDLRKNVSTFLDAGDVPLPSINADSGPKNLTNFPQFLQDTKRIRSALNEVNADGLVFGLGGECSICVGTLGGLKAKIKGEPGIVWIDAHGDFNTPATTPSGFIGGMCLALACGRGPEITEVMRDGKPVLGEKNVVHLASRAFDPLEFENMSSSPMKIYSAATLRKDGITSTVSSAAASLADRCDWIICHLDVDSLDPRIVSAVNFPEPGGLTVEEAKAIVAAVQRTDKLKLFELAGYNPILDPDRRCANRLVRLTSDILA
jgi:arginase